MKQTCSAPRNEKRSRLHEPEVLKAIGAESRQKGTDDLSFHQIDHIIRKTRKLKQKP
jgi:hypothetical protein